TDQIMKLLDYLMLTQRFNMPATHKLEQQAIGSRFRMLAATLPLIVPGILIRIKGYLQLRFVVRGLLACRPRQCQLRRITIFSSPRRMGRMFMQRLPRSLRRTNRNTRSLETAAN